MVIFAAILFPVFSAAREKARETSCLSNVKQISMATLMYAQDYDEQLPQATEWQTNFTPYIKDEKIYHCPAVVFTQEQATPPATTYAYNSALDRMKLKRLADPANTVSNYDSSNFSRNANDALTSLPSPGRHLKGNNISFADGHARFWSDAEPLPQGKILPDTP